jgi:hypothetical protein
LVKLVTNHLKNTSIHMIWIDLAIHIYISILDQGGNMGGGGNGDGCEAQILVNFDIFSFGKSSYDLLTCDSVNRSIIYPIELSKYPFIYLSL